MGATGRRGTAFLLMEVRAVKRELPMPIVVAILVVVILGVIVGGWMYIRSWDASPPPPKTKPQGPPPQNTQQLNEPEV